jgi:ubiquinone/menaquinone biosynthesis C-methylase UbiE
MDQNRGATLAGWVLVAAGVIVTTVAIWPSITGSGTPEIPCLIVGIGAIVAGAFFVQGHVKKLVLGPKGVEVEAGAEEQPAEIAQQELDPAVEAQRRAFAETKAIPGEGAPAFDALSALPSRPHIPTSHPMVPMYVLDSSFRILDWNDAFTLAFDRTMEGRRGLSVLEWVYFLDNYEQVLEHGSGVFAKDKVPPDIDIEALEFTSLTYGKISATKRAYRIPNDDGGCFGWLVILEPEFEDRAKSIQYYHDLLQVLQSDLMWSHYAMSYDRVLNRTDSYPELLNSMIGARGDLPEIPPHTYVLDLGAGTGNLTWKLADPAKGRYIVALDNNDSMLRILRERCQERLRGDGEGPGIDVIKQDINTLYGLQDCFFDYAMLNNVLYDLDDPMLCLRGVHRVLRQGGEVRVSGPKRNTNLDRLFRQLRAELARKSVLDELARDLERVEAIHRRHLADRLYRWDVPDLERMLRETDLTPTYATDKAYAGQAMVVSARK